MGYARAGYEVMGVDCVAQPNYPFTFVKADALTYDLGHGEFDLIHASPPCQFYSRTQPIYGREHLDLVDRVRDRLIESGALYVIENVEGAPLIDPIMLCGGHFKLQVYRHRLFESNYPLTAPTVHPWHIARCTIVGQRHQPGEFMTVTGHFRDLPVARKAMGIDWMKRSELAQAIPPAYSEYIGRQILGSATLTDTTIGEHSHHG